MSAARFEPRVGVPLGPRSEQCACRRNAHQERSGSCYGYPNLYVISPALPVLLQRNWYASKQWQSLSLGERSFKLLLVDTPPLLNLADVELITAACDGVCGCRGQLHTKRDVLQKCAGQIDSKKLLGLGLQRGGRQRVQKIFLSLLYVWK